jgi:hypothetical protein
MAVRHLRRDPRVDLAALCGAQRCIAFEASAERPDRVPQSEAPGDFDQLRVGGKGADEPAALDLPVLEQFPVAAQQDAPFGLRERGQRTVRPFARQQRVEAEQSEQLRERAQMGVRDETRVGPVRREA